MLRQTCSDPNAYFNEGSPQLMRTLFADTTSVRPVASGTGRYTRALVSALAARNTVICSPGCWHPKQGGGEAEGEVLNPPGYHRELNLTLAGNRPNITADAGFFPNYFMPPAWPYPAAVTVHDLSFLSHPQFYSRKMRSWYRHRLTHTLRNACLILTVSETSRQSIIRHTGFAADRILVHPPAPPLQLQSPVPVHEEPYLLYIGNLEPKKNIENMLLAFRKVRKQRSVSLVLAGRLHGPAAWTRRIRRLIAGTAGVTYAGFVSEARMQDLLAFSSGLVLVSHIEGFGLPVMDALANEIPVLISQDAALQEVAGKWAVTADETSAASITSGMMQLQERTSADLSGAGRAMAQRFGSEACILATERITRKLTHQKRAFHLLGEPRQHHTAILAGIAYADVFGTGITRRKLHRSLSGVKLSYEAFSQALDELLSYRDDAISESNGLLQLRPVNGQSQPDQAEEAGRVRRRHARLLRLVMASPWVRGLYYSGGTAHGSGLDAQPDLDLLVVAAPNRSWLAYAWIRAVSRLAGRGSTVCANYVLAENTQQVHWQRDFYTAFQLLFLRKVSLKPGTMHIRSHNHWMKTHFPNARLPEESGAEKMPAKEGLLSRLNLLLMFVWSAVWKRSGLQSGTGGLLWDAHRIKLHTRDHRPQVKQAFAERMRRFGGLPAGSAAVSIRKKLS